jgi:diguanylate cyclase (GGDEF)-like protein
MFGGAKIRYEVRMILDAMPNQDNTEDRLLKIIHTQNEIATSDLELDAAMQLAADRALQLTEAGAAMIESPDGSDQFVFQVTAGDADRFRGQRIDREHSLAGRALRERRILACDDCARDPRVHEPIRRKLGAGSLICVPLFHRAKTIGVLTVAHPEPHHFSAGDAQTLELLSDLIAAHLSHAEMLAEEAHDSRHDALTDLPNRRAYEEQLRHEVARSRRYRKPLALCLFDLDGFKGVNDSLGHPAGDRVLRAVAAAIRKTRSADMGFRIGGDEFAVLLPETNARDAVAGVQRVIDELARTEVEGLDGIGISYGIASGENDADSLHDAADRELLAAKAALYGRDGKRRGSVAA